MDIVYIGKCELWFVIAQFFWSVYTQFLESRSNFLENVWVDSFVSSFTFFLHGLNKTACQSKVIKTTACLQSCNHNLGFWNKIHTTQVIHCLTDFPSINIWSVEVIFISCIKFCISFYWAMSHITGHRNCGGSSCKGWSKAIAGCSGKCFTEHVGKCTAGEQL